MKIKQSQLKWCLGFQMLKDQKLGCLMARRGLLCAKSSRAMICHKTVGGGGLIHRYLVSLCYMEGGEVGSVHLGMLEK